jgi:gamma-glutamyltranspeptidase/glutathione hydrolase
MVATGSPEATMAGVEILERGGNAIDAAVAAALALGVADGDASGIAGATIALVHLAHGPTIAIDGSSRTPSFLDLERLKELKAAGRNYGYETIAVPATLAALEHMRSRFGTMSFAELAAPAIAIAEQGYALSAIQIAWTEHYYDNIMAASTYMPFLAMEDGHTIGQAGDRQCQPELAATLRRLAREGVASFYRGPVADQIEADMVANGGFLRKADLAMYRVQELSPLRTTYRGREVLTFPPPGGGATLIAILALLETFPSSSLAEDSADRHHTLIEAARIAHADKYLAAGAGLARRSGSGLDRGGFPTRAIVPGHAISPSELAPDVPAHCMESGESTTQISVADQDGNVVSLTQTLSRSFGAKVATPGLGFPYNSFLETFNVTDSRCPGYIAPRMPCANDMAPTIVFEDGRLLAALGTPGSSRIPSIIGAVISNLIDRRFGLLEAVTEPRVVWGGIRRLRAFVEEAGPVTAEQVATLALFGHEDMTVVTFPPGKRIDVADFGGVNAVAFEPRTGTFIGVVDPRRGGLAEGPRVIAPRR